MQIIDNRTRVRGVVQHVSTQSNIAQFGLIRLLVQQLAPVANMADLLSARDPTSLTLLVPLADLTDTVVAEGQMVELEARLTAPERIFAQEGTLRRIN